jgi:outer membrane protein assembly factor BamB
MMISPIIKWVAAIIACTVIVVGGVKAIPFLQGNNISAPGSPGLSSSSHTINSWPMVGYDAEGTRYNSGEHSINTSNVNTLVSDWSYTIRNFTIVGSPVVANGVVYIGGNSESGNRPGTIYALDAQKGTLLWSHILEPSITTSPPVVANGVVYIGDRGVLTVRDSTPSMPRKGRSSGLTHQHPLVLLKSLW